MRRRRTFLPGQPLHVIQRGNNRQIIFFTHQDAANFLTWLGEAAVRHGLKIHAYVLMPNHFHLLVSADQAECLPRTIQSLGRRYVRHINGRLARTGTLWEGRYRATVIDTENYFFRCSRYIELNPVRARLAAEPGSCPWSSYSANALGIADALINPHALYLALERDDTGRSLAYRNMFTDSLSEATLDAIRAATNGGWPLGDTAFQARVAGLSGQRTQPLPRGRPKAIKSTKESASCGFLE